MMRYLIEPRDKYLKKDMVSSEKRQHFTDDLRLI